MKKNILFLVVLLIGATGLKVKSQDKPPVILHYQMAQPREALNDATPVTFIYSADKINSKEAVLVITAKIKKGWHIYSQKSTQGGPVKTTITFQSSKNYSLIGKTSEPKPITVMDKSLKVEVSYFENSVVFKQKVKTNGSPIEVKGVIEYMAGKGTENLPPVSKEFKIMLM